MLGLELNHVSIRAPVSVCNKMGDPTRFHEMNLQKLNHQYKTARMAIETSSTTCGL